MFKITILPQKISWIHYLSFVFMAIVLGYFLFRATWTPTTKISTEHYQISSTATLEQTKKIGDMIEMVNSTYISFFKDILPSNYNNSKMELVLYKDRDEFKKYNYSAAWAEAFYSMGCCYAYYSEKEKNSCQWMIHESVHQLNNEVADFKLVKWLDEGVSLYFNTSQIKNGKILLGEVDPLTYPIWWLSTLKLTNNLKSDLENGIVVPLKDIIAGKGGTTMNSEFNLYYMHWWSLTHYILHGENGKYRNGFFKLVAQTGDLSAFERNVGNVENIQEGWYKYLMELCKLHGTTSSKSN